ncbi:tonsoku-like protein [Anopheles ziemanni]|uniref:tonsoku-like protein n=1 Tax=Anopheles coustani TaxID=139045 RepID=UPI002657AD12|nr:tonsoku-like protein [Anopheles coustani]XP_058177948.1 tonsoku-like protein [Anopheles ziemanni]
MGPDERKLVNKKTKYANQDNYLSLAETCQRLGELYKDREEYQRALNEYKLAAKAYEKLNRLMDRGLAFRMIGEMHLMMGQFKEALQNVQAYSRAARNEANQLEIQRANVTLGRVYLHRAESFILEKKTSDAEADLIEAEKAFNIALSICDKLQGTVRKAEFIEMQAGTYLNLGVTLDRRGKTNPAQVHMERAIRLAREADSFELLHTCYNTMALSCSQWEKNNDGEHRGKTLRLLNHGLEVASRLSNRATKMCQTLLLKTDFFLQMGDFQSARQTLKRAYHLKTPVSSDAKQIAQQLKVLVAICRTEDELITLEATNYERRKTLYERMGDGACKLRNFVKAIDYYRRMLECAEALGDANRQLIPCYVSLYQTYTDNQQYDLALEYLWKEYEIIANEPKEAYHTLLQIAKLYERQEKSFFDIEDIYRRARVEAKKLQSIDLERVAVQRAVKMLRKNCMDLMADTLEQEAIAEGIDLSIVEPDSEGLPDMDCLSEVDEDDGENEQNTPNVGDDINLDIDLSENSDVEGEANLGGGIGSGKKLNDSIPDALNASTSAQGRTRKRGMTFAVRRNNKGETQLHQAAIAGNTVLVERLLEQGHPVNVRDHAGWLPLHEACIHGHADIVTTLLDRGAHMNDKGGTSCDGITPLYDACCNGRLEVIEVLLDRGANATQRTDFGDTTLNVLDTWYSKRKARLSLEEIHHYERVRERLVAKFDAVAEQVSPPSVDRRPAKKDFSSGSKITVKQNSYSSDSDTPTDSTAHTTGSSSSKVKSLRSTGSSSASYGSKETVMRLHRNAVSSSDDERSPKRVSINGASDDELDPVGVSEYRSTMLALRKNKITDHRATSLSLAGQKKRLAHMALDEVDADDWLIDDLQQTAKRSRVTPSTLPRSASSSLERKKSSSSFGKNRSSSDLTGVDATPPSYSTDCASALLDADDDDLPFADEPYANDCWQEQESTDSAFNVLMKNSAKSFRRIQNRRGSSETRARRHSLGIAQTSLLDAGFQRIASPCFDEKENLTPPEDRLRTPVKQTTPTPVAPSPHKSPAAQPSMKQTFHVVLDDGKTVDLFFNDQTLFTTRTIGWLQNEIVKRYIMCYGKRPLLKIKQSKDLHAFSESEYLNVLTENRVPGLNTEITVHGMVRGCQHVDFAQFYEEYCQENKKVNDKNLQARLIKLERTGSIILEPDFALTVPSQPLPATDTLSFVFLLVFFQQDWLNHLDLSVNGITDNHMETLARYLPSCKHLRVLRLALNLLTSRSVEMLCYGVKNPLDLESLSGSLTVGGLKGSGLEELDLSSNPLEDDAIAPLFVLCNELSNLRVLRLGSTDIMTIDESNVGNFDISRLETFDVSQNKLHEHSVQYLLNQLSEGHLRDASFHSLAALCTDFKPKLWQTISNTQLGSLRALNLSNCRLTDDEIENTLLPSLGRNCEKLVHLDLSVNVALTKRTFLSVLRQCNGAVFRLEQLHFRHNVQLWVELDTIAPADQLKMIEYNPSVQYPRELLAMLPVGDYTVHQHETLLTVVTNLWRTLWSARTPNLTKHDDGLHITFSVDK